ncbi:MAG: hypothetical protein ACOYNC_14950 [Bacteroidales bacterium]
MKKLIISMTAFLIFLLTGTCFAKEKVTLSKKSVTIDHIALVCTYLDITPDYGINLYTAALRSKMFKISDQINLLMKNKVGQLRDSMALLLTTKFNCKVEYGQDLYRNSGFDVLKGKYDNNSKLTKDNEHFPQLIMPEGEVNYFPFTKNHVDRFGYGVISYFKKSDDYKEQITDICKTLNVNFIAVFWSNINTYAGDMMTHVKTGVTVNFCIFDKDGDCIANGFNLSKPMNFNPDQIGDYNQPLNRILTEVDPILVKIAEKFVTK